MKDAHGLNMKTACLTGITGQTGSYLAEILLEQGFEVWGLKRSASNFNTQRIDHIYDNPNLHLVYGDLADYSSLLTFVNDTKPDLFFNCGALSHVRVSFDIPEYAMDITGTGVVRCLEALRRCSPKTRFLQCSTSELFGSTPPPQNENTKFHPRSPYACAKLAGYWSTVNYREAYDMFAVNAIGFNHECIEENTPLLIRDGGKVSVISVKDLVPLRKKGPGKQGFELQGIEVWNGSCWDELKYITATRVEKENKDHDLLLIQCRGGNIITTSHHQMLDHNYSERRADSLKEGDALAHGQFPQTPGWTAVSPELAEFLGYMASDGSIPKNRHSLQFTNNDRTLRSRVSELWSKLFLGTSRDSVGRSGFSDNSVGQMYLTGKNELCEWLRGELYTKDGHKKVPDLILNSSIELQKAFLDAYYAGDGLKAGNGMSFKTNSVVLAQGLVWMYSLQGFKSTIYTQERADKKYVFVNITNNKTALGAHLKKPKDVVRKISGVEHQSRWVFDLETDTEHFMGGVGNLVVHNSPRRAENFVTRKITRAATRIKAGLQEKIVLGNLDSKRDWGHARDTARALYMILTADKPDDYVVATGSMYSVKQFLEMTFTKLGMNWKDYVEFDPKYLRPSEVDALCGDPSKIKDELGWEPEISFEQLVEEMIDSDMRLAMDEKVISESRE